MNTKGIKFLAVLAVLAMAFAVFAVAGINDADSNQPAALSEEPGPAAKIGDLEYDTLKGAVKAATAGQTVVILKDLVLTSTQVIDKNLTIDLNGKTITGNNVRVLQITTGNVTITGEGTVKLVAANENPIGYDKSAVRVGDNDNKAAKLTIDKDVKITSDRAYTISIFNGKNETGKKGTETVSLIVKGTVEYTWNGTEVDEQGRLEGATAISGVGSGYNGPTSVTVEEGAMVKSTKTSAIYFPCAGKLTVNGELVGGIEMKAGDGSLEVGEKASITAVGTDKQYHKPNGNGQSTNGFAIAICENENYKGNATFEVKGGIIDGDVALLRDTHECQKVGNISIKDGMINGKVWFGYTGDQYEPEGKISIEGGTFSDGNILQFIKAGSTVTITGTTALGGKVPAGRTTIFTIDPNTVINYAAGAKLEISAPNNASLEVNIYTLTNKGVINLDKGASVTGYDKTITSHKANVKEDGGKLRYAGSDVTPKTTGETGDALNTEIAADIKDQTSAVIELTAESIATDDTKAIDISTKDVAFIGNNNTITKMNFTVGASTAGGSVSFSGFDKVSGTITTTDGTKSQTVKLTDFVGDFTVSKGSVIVDGKYHGIIEITSGTELKLAGEVDGDFTINYGSTTGTAKVIVEAGKEKKLEILQGKSLIINSKYISLTVDGVIFGLGGIQSNGNITVNDGGMIFVDSIKDTIAGNTPKTEDITITANSGSVIIAMGADDAAGGIVLAGSKSQLVAYSGSDINAIDCNDQTKILGKDAANGTWSVDADGILTLDNYNGTYNLGSIVAPKIIVIGDNKITYAIPEGEVTTPITENNFFDSPDIYTVRDTGSLTVEIDASKMTKAAIETGFVVLDEVKTIDSVNITVKVSGTNPAWDAKKITVCGIHMDGAAAVTIDNSDIVVDVLSAYTADEDNVVGISVTTTTNNEITPIDLTVNSSTITVTSAGTGIYADDIELKNKSGMYVLGKAIGADAATLDVKGSSLAGIAGGASVSKKISVMQDSALSIEGLVFGGAANAAIDNYGTLNLNGNTVIGLGATVSNSAVMNIEDSMNVFGVLENKDGTITNKGTITVFAKEFDIHAATQNVEATNEITFANGVLSTSYENKAVVKSITINETEFQKDGSLKIVDAVLAFETHGANENVDIITENDHFSGTLTAAQDVVNETGVAYRLTLSNGNGGASISLTYNKALTKDNYAVTVSGAVSGSVGQAAVKSYTMAKPILDGIVDKVVNGIKDIDGSKISVVGGTFANESIVTNFGTTEIGLKGLFDGNLIAGVKLIDIDGTFDGNIVTDGMVTIDKDAAGTMNGKVIGDIIAKGGVVSTGLIEGNIVSEASVTVYDIQGNIAVYRMSEDAELKVTVTGKAVGNLTYNTKYKATKDAETKTPYTATLGLDADLKDAKKTRTLTIDLIKGQDATATEAVIPGYFAFAKADELATGKKVGITMTEGKFAFPQDIKLPIGYALVFETGTIAEVAPIATLDVSDAALKVSKDAKSNFVTGTAPITDYGLVKCIMSFTIEGGAYTIYSDVAYAVSNCEEGSTLTVEAANAPINSTITIPKNVEVIVGNGCTMSFGKYGLSMSEGAKITLAGTGKVTFGVTEQPSTTLWTVWTVSGTFVYDGNVVKMEDVRFKDASEISGVAATTTEASKIKVNLTYADGTAGLDSGNGIGAIVLKNGSEVKTKGADETLISGHFTVASGAVFEATKLEDAAYATKDDKGKEETAKATSVIVGGTLKLLDDVTVKGAYIGTGAIVLADNKTITVTKATKVVGMDNEYYGAIFTGIVNDTAATANSFAYNLVYASINSNFAIKAVKDGTKQYVQMSGEIGSGIINGMNETSVAALKDLKVCKLATVKADTVDILPATGGDKSVTVEGAVVTKTINMDKTGYGSMKYDSTYEKEGYTFYTAFENIDFDYAGDITIANDVEVKKKLDLSGNDVNIVIADGKKLILEAIMIIGTPATSVGDEGSSIAGKVIINKAEVYLVVYADVDLSEAEIVGADGKTDAVFSKLDVENVPYAAIFAQDGNDIKLSKADAAIIPEIIGYNFTAWLNYNGDASAKIGETNAYADSAAILVTVMVKYVAGVDYYMNGALFDALNVYTDVPYGSYFTAKISDTSKYQGNPMVNGEKTVYVIDDMEIVASGVTPIPEPPAPEPVIGDSGISLTDILLIVLVVLIAIMVVILVLRLNRS